MNPWVRKEDGFIIKPVYLGTVCRENAQLQGALTAAAGGPSLTMPTTIPHQDRPGLLVAELLLASLLEVKVPTDADDCLVTRLTD